jgi:hypothetical protein
VTSKSVALNHETAFSSFSERGRLVVVMFATEQMPFGSSARVKNESSMKKATRKPKTNGKRRAPRVPRDEILPEYDFSNGRPNPYASRIAANATLVKLDPDVAAAFPNAEAVNHALRALAGIIQGMAPPSRRRSGSAKRRRSATGN